LIDFTGPAALALGVIFAVGALRHGPFESTASADPQYSQSASSLQGGTSPSTGPLFNSNAFNQRKVQTDVLREVLTELRAIRQLLQGGDVRVRVESIELDYDRLTNAVSAAVSSAGSGSGSSSGVIRRISDGNGKAGESDGK
jgi:hypothetical protein